jgi:hypothetical protein
MRVVNNNNGNRLFLFLFLHLFGAKLRFAECNRGSHNRVGVKVSRVMRSLQQLAKEGIAIDTRKATPHYICTFIYQCRRRTISYQTQVQRLLWLIFAAHRFFQIWEFFSIHAHYTLSESHKNKSKSIELKQMNVLNVVLRRGIQSAFFEKTCFRKHVFDGMLCGDLRWLVCIVGFGWRR